MRRRPTARHGPCSGCPHQASWPSRRLKIKQLSSPRRRARDCGPWEGVTERLAASLRPRSRSELEGIPPTITPLPHALPSAVSAIGRCYDPRGGWMSSAGNATPLRRGAWLSAESAPRRPTNSAQPAPVIPGDLASGRASPVVPAVFHFEAGASGPGTKPGRIAGARFQPAARGRAVSAAAAGEQPLRANSRKECKSCD